MKKSFLVLTLLLSIVLLLVYCNKTKPSLKADSLLFENFEQFKVGILPFTSLASSIGKAQLGCGKLDWLKFELGVTPHPIFVCEENGNKHLRVLLQKGEIRPVTGSQWNTHLDSSYSELTLSYRVKFDSAFVFKPGKFPGISGGYHMYGVKPNGHDGFSASLMYWQGGRLSLYVYHPDQKINFGDIIFDSPDSSSFCFAVNRWYSVLLHVKVNDVGKSNGVVFASVDGKVVLRKERIRFRDVANIRFDEMYFSVFANEIPPQNDEYMYFDDIKLTAN